MSDRWYGGPVRVLFSLQRAPFLKNFDSVVRLLAERGHSVDVAIAQPAPPLGGEQALLDELAAIPGVTVEFVAPPAWERMRETARHLRGTLDYFAYLDPRFPPSYRRAWESRAARPARIAGRSPLARRTLVPLLKALEASAPPSAELARFLRARDPHVLLLSPHIFPHSHQPELLAAAKTLGIPAAVCVHSWDNLTSKGKIRLLPDRVFVWNELQRREAATYHGLPAELVTVTGAQAYDWWFERRARPREEFCARIGLDPRQPIVLYACSAPWSGRAEAEFVLPWIEAIRSAGGRLETVGILIRPHPKRAEAWSQISPDRYPNVAVWPRKPELPGALATRADYFDSIFHSAALVGANTSAMIEAAILRKPVLTLSLPEFAEEQTETIHFRYLNEVAGGLLATAATREEHVGQLARALEDPESAARRADAFTEIFVRPYGRNVPATPRFADEVERLAASQPEPLRPAPQARLFRGVLLAGSAVYLTARAAWRAAKRAVRPRAPGTGWLRRGATPAGSAAQGAPSGRQGAAGRAGRGSVRSRARTGRAG